jgi:hypothetical protein
MPLSDQKTVTSAGSAEALGNQDILGPLMVKALSTNTGVIYLGNDGAEDVDSSNGLHLEKGEAVVFEFVGNLASLMLDASVNGEGVAWIQLCV